MLTFYLNKTLKITMIFGFYKQEVELNTEMITKSFKFLLVYLTMYIYRILVFHENSFKASENFHKSFKNNGKSPNVCWIQICL